MATPFIGQITMVSFNFAPKGFALCNGQLLPINQNTALFSILGTTYGGNGTTNFALPNLQGCVPVHAGSNAGNNYTLGQTGGAANVTLLGNQAGHTHPVAATATATTNTAAGHFPAAAASAIYGSGTDAAMNTAIVSTAGGGQAHNNLQPYLVINYVIALSGIFPSRN